MDIINYSKIKKVEKDLLAHKEDYMKHLNSNMPHLVKDEDTGKVYKVGRRFKDGGMQKTWEEVL